jgi:DNA-binding IclR family transcriptional regulator
MRFDSRNGASVLDRAFMVLQVLGEEGASLSLAEAARRSGLPKATVYRLLTQLVGLDVVERLGGEYVLGPRLFSLGSDAARLARLRDAAAPYMTDLYQATHEVITLGLLDQHTVLLVERIFGPGNSQVRSRVGARWPLHCTALGKAVLAQAPESTRERLLERQLGACTPRTLTAPRLLRDKLNEIGGMGIAFDQEEFRPGMRCVAAPIFDETGETIAAISVSGTTARVQPTHAASALRSAAGRISQTLKAARQ